MSGFQSPNYTQAPNDFFDMLPEMSEAELRVTLVMIRQTFGFHRDDFKMGLNKLATAAGLSRNGAKSGAEAAESRGTFRRTNPQAQTEAEWELVVSQTVTPSASDHPPLQPVTTPPSVGDPQVGVKERIKKEKQRGGDLLDLTLEYAAIGKERGEDKAEAVLAELENGLHVNIDRSLTNQQIAKRILRDGRPVSAFISWVMSDEWRASHAYMYADMARVWQQWPQAFVAKSGYNPQGLEVNF